MPIRKYVSLGIRCSVAWQIRRHFDQPEAYPFDWLVTPLQSVAPLIRCGFESMARPETLRLAQYNDQGYQTIHDTGAGILLHHDFPRKPGAPGMIKPGWEEKIATVRAKYDHIAENWARLEEADEIVFIRERGEAELPLEVSVTSTGSTAVMNLLATLEDRFPAARIVLALVNCSVRPNVLFPEVVKYTVRPPAMGPEMWKGDDESWGKVMTSLESLTFQYPVLGAI